MGISGKIEQLVWWMRITQKDALDVNEASVYLCISPSHLRHLATERDIPHYKSGGRLFFSKREIDEWRLQDRVPSNAEIRQQATLINLSRH